MRRVPSTHPAAAPATLAALATVSALVLTGADWPGTTRTLAEGFDAAPVAQRVDVLQTACGHDPEGDALVLHALADTDASVRRTAAEVAGRAHLAAAAPMLVTWLSDPRPELRATALHTLGALGAVAAQPEILRALGDTDVAVRLAAVDAVGALAPAQTPAALLDRVTDPEAAVRIAVARVLGDAGDPRATLALLGALQDSTPEVRSAAARALGQIRDPMAVGALLALVRDPVASVRMTAVRAVGSLGTLGERAVADLASLALREDPMGDAVAREALTRAAIESLGRIGGERAGLVLVQVFRANELDATTARTAAQALGMLGPAPRERIRALTAQPVPELLTGPLVDLLGDLGGDAAAAALMALTESPTFRPEYRDAALRALGRTGAPAAVIALLSAADSSRVQATSQTRAVGDPVGAALAGLHAWVQVRGRLDAAALDPLVDLLRAPRPIARGGSIPRTVDILRLIGETHNPRAAAVLAAYVNGSVVPEVRLAALEALRRTGIAGVDGVVASLDDARPEIRLAAADALARHGDAGDLRAVQAHLAGHDTTDRVSGMRAWGRMVARLGHAPVDTGWMVERVRHGSAGQSAAALDALADATAVGDTDARDALVNALQDPTLAPTAAEALGNALRTAPRAAAPALAAPLCTVLEHPGTVSLRANAAWALGGADEGAVPALLAALGDVQAPVAASAAGALATLARQTPAAVATARDTVCVALAHASLPLVRANLLLATARAGIGCDLRGVRESLTAGRSPWVRAAAAQAARVLVQGAGTAAYADVRRLATALDRCARDDASPQVAARCAAAANPPGDGGGNAVEDADDVDLVVSDASGVAAAGLAYGLVLPDGVTRVGYTGPDGWIHVRAAGHGVVAVVDPEALPPE